jgi:vacuolar protein sorting-associated protein 13A/C
MLEPVLAYYLNQYLGKYVTGLDADKLRLSVWAGDVVLKGLKLRSEALKDLNLPITVKGGVLGTLRLKVRVAAAVYGAEYQVKGQQRR